MALNNAINSPVLGNVASLTSGEPVIGQGTGTITTVAQLPVPNGGTGAATLTGMLLGNGTSAVSALSLTSNALLIGNGTDAPGEIATGTDGQVLVGSSAGAAAFATLTSSNNSISFTTSANGLDLVVANPSQNVTWNVVNPGTVSVTANAYNGYALKSNGSCAFNLPATGVLGATFYFANCSGGSRFTVNAAAGGTLVILGDSGTSAASGNDGEALTLTCVTAGAAPVYQAVVAPLGNITVA